MILYIIFAQVLASETCYSEVKEIKPLYDAKSSPKKIHYSNTAIENSTKVSIDDINKYLSFYPEKNDAELVRKYEAAKTCIAQELFPNKRITMEVFSGYIDVYYKTKIRIYLKSISKNHPKLYVYIDETRYYMICCVTEKKILATYEYPKKKIELTLLKNKLMHVYVYSTS